MEKHNELFSRIGTLTRLGLKLLISSQASLPIGKSVEIHTLDRGKYEETMSYDECAKTDGGKLFIETLGRDPKPNEEDSFKILVREMGGHPLSIILTATYCRQCASIDDVKNEWSAIEINIPDSDERDTHKSLMCALELAWQQVSKSKAAIFIWALHTYSIYPLDDDMISRLNEFVDKPFPKNDLRDGRNVLRNYGLIDIMDDGKAHMLLCIKKNLKNLDKTEKFKAEIELAFLAWIKWCCRLLKLGNDRKNKEYAENHKRALKWLPQCFSLVEQCLDKQEYNVLFLLLVDAGNYYTFDSVHSLPLLARLTQEIPKEFPVQSLWHLKLGDLLKRTGKQGEALEAYDEAERLFKKENDDLGLANVLQSRGALLRDNEDISGAKKCYEEAYHLYEKEQVYEFVGYTLCDLLVCCALLDDDNGFQTYMHKLQQILPLLPKDAREKILMLFHK